MLRIALRMLFGDRTKYLTLVLSLAFATMLINQQGAIFLGLLDQATGVLQNVHQADLWVTDPGTRWVAEYRPLADRKLARVRSVPGVEWAEPFYNAWAVVELPDGAFRRVQIIGVPRGTMVGRPPEITLGNIEDLRIPDAVMVEEVSRGLLGNPDLGDVLKMNDKRAVVVGVCKAKRGFESNAVVYTTFENALRFSPGERKRISYVLVKVRPGEDLARVQRDINALGDVVALTHAQFRARSIGFIVVETGIGINFGITIVLGFIVGLLLSGSVLYQFTAENLKFFAVLKAMGAGAPALVGMVLAQSLTVGVIGYGIGVGAAGAFAIASSVSQSELAAVLPWELVAGSLFATLITIILASLVSIRRVLRVQPAMIFAGT